MITQASNLTLLVDLHGPGGEPTGHRAVYKPVRGERPLVDFAPQTLAAREVAAYLVSRAGSWDLVPPTVLRDGPLGVGSVQFWVEHAPGRPADPSAGLVEVLPVEELVGSGMLAVVGGADEEGNEVVVAHADDAQLRSMAVLDSVLNNADRKAAHLALDQHGRLRGFDHGLCLHQQDKLRTVLWGWAGQRLPTADRARLAQLHQALTQEAEEPALSGVLLDLLDPSELEALVGRTTMLLEHDSHPRPPETRYPLPWPLW